MLIFSILFDEIGQCSLCRKSGRLRLDKIHGETRSWTSCSHEQEEEAKSQEEDHHKMSLHLSAQCLSKFIKKERRKQINHNLRVPRFMFAIFCKICVCKHTYFTSVCLNAKNLKNWVCSNTSSCNSVTGVLKPPVQIMTENLL